MKDRTSAILLVFLMLATLGIYAALAAVIFCTF